ncbi:MAG: L-histidine N(alpha)-methyltransferase [Actinomycetota bacterium]|nr:L-histidine N(alpha)-methyltransferase [Actinomycetota bacterium]
MTLPLDVHLRPDVRRAALLRDVRQGLTATPKWVPSKYFYDARGSLLFDEITRLPEYYLTRAERAVLAQRAGEIARLSSATTLVELGSGTSEKTRLLLSALREGGTLQRFLAVDVDPTVLTAAGESLAAAYPGLAVHGVVADFEHHLHLLPGGGPRLVAFLGSTVGNLEPVARRRFLGELSGSLAPGDGLLLGTDLVKDPARLLAAYDDAAGVTAAFNRNVLAVLDRELGADFGADGFGHVARWDADREWVEMRLRSEADRAVTVPALDLVVGFAAGEEMRTEISAKFRRETVEAELAAAGLEIRRWWTDAAGDFAVSLSVRA